MFFPLLTHALKQPHCSSSCARATRLRFCGRERLPCHNAFLLLSLSHLSLGARPFRRSVGRTKRRREGDCDIIESREGKRERGRKERAVERQRERLPWLVPPPTDRPGRRTTTAQKAYRTKPPASPRLARPASSAALARESMSARVCLSPVRRRRRPRLSFAGTPRPRPRPLLHVSLAQKLARPGVPRRLAPPTLTC